VAKQETTVEKVRSSLKSLSQIGEVLPAVARVRSEPDIHSPIVQRIGKGTRLQVVGADGEWLKVELINGSSGWIYHSLVRRIEHKPLPAM
jgi:N-acetylmuramoyl-L-alanine amidase